MESKTCKFCGEKINGKRDDAIFCSNTCKAKHWERKRQNKGLPHEETVKEKKDVTSQLRGLLNGNVNQKGEILPESTQQGLIKIIVPLYKELSAPFDTEIRRLTDVRTQLTKGIENLKMNLKILLNQNGYKLLLGMAGTGALLGNVSSENKTKGTILGGTFGLISGAVMKEITQDSREKDKRIKSEKIVNEINSMISKLNLIDRQVIIQKEKIKALPLLQKKEIQIPAPFQSAKQNENIIITSPPANEFNPLSRLHKDVSDVTLMRTDSDKIINSQELKKMDFKILDFKEKWNIFFGNPSVTFHCIIHGMPGEGKSTFAIQFAKYLAENIGRVVYISGEEGFTKTLRDKFLNNNSISNYLDVADLRTYEDIIKNIQQEVYNFIFIDSLDNMRIDAEKMRKIRERYKNSALITISQSTKDGKIRGSNELVHDCDISVCVENGIAKTTKNRFKEKWMIYEVFL